MKFTFLLSLLLIISATHAQSDNKIVAGTIDSVYSTILKENRKIWVSVPDGAKSGIFTPLKYPVVYLLDGDAHFLSVTGMLQALSGSSVIPEMIVVAIPNTNRMRDLTPTKSSIGPDGKASPMTEGSGGGEMFTKFIKEELMPYVESHYPAAPYKMYIGHSLGGLMVMDALIHHPEMFNSYLAIDPSMWWDGQKLLKEATTVLQQKSFAGKSLFLAIANTMSEGMDIVKVKKDTAANSTHIRSNLQLVSMLEKNKKNNLSWSWKYYNDDSHGSVPLVAEYDAFRSFFKGLGLKFPNGPADTSWFTVDYVRKHYEMVSKKMGYKVLPPEQTVNELAYGFMAMGYINIAEQFFKLNTDTYPQSFNAFDSMGDLYAAKGDKDKAAATYAKALAIKENPGTRMKLEALNKKEFQLSAAQLQQYIGDYELAPGFTLTVTVRDNKIYTQATGQPEVEIYASKADQFYLKVVPAEIEFVRNDGGKVEKLILRQGGKEMEGKKVK